MKTFHTQEEFLKEFPIIDGVINCKLQSLTLLFNLDVQASIVNAGHINARDINARDIKARDINARDIKAWHINARDIEARDIKARDIKARDIKAWNIEARDIKARDIKAWNIEACDIKARDISFYAVCFAYNNIKCKSIEGRRDNSKYFSFDGKIIINGVTQENKEAKEEMKVSENEIKIMDHVTLKKIEKILGYDVVNVNVVKQNLI